MNIKICQEIDICFTNLRELLIKYLNNAIIVTDDQQRQEQETTIYSKYQTEINRIINSNFKLSTPQTQQSTRYGYYGGYIKSKKSRKSKKNRKISKRRTVKRV